jgi:carbon monoxide dehydrogenase subunit G
MATIHKEIFVDAPPEHVWAAIRDVGAVHTRLAQEFVVSTRLERESRLVTFANGAIVRERIVAIDEERRRLAYSVTDWDTTHHNASFQVFPDGEGHARIVWVADLLPNDLAAVVDRFMQEGSTAIRRTLEATSSRKATVP